MALQENNNLAEKVRELRERNGYKQHDFATLLKLARTTYVNKESSGKFTSEELAMLAKELRIDISVFQKLIPEKIMTINDAIALITKDSVRNEAYQDIHNAAMSEVLAFIRNFGQPLERHVTPKQVLGSLIKDLNKKIGDRLNEAEQK